MLNYSVFFGVKKCRTMKNVWMLAVVLMAGCSSSKVLVNNPQTVPFVADGKATEWGENVNYDTKSRLIYKISNDANYLYVMLKIADEQTQRRMLGGGMTVWVDTTDHKKQMFGITFPRGKSPMSEFIAAASPRSNTRGEGAISMKDRLQESLLELETFFYGYTEPHVMYVGESKIQPVMDIDSSKSFIYECTIPIGYFLKYKKSTQPISIGFMIGSGKKLDSFKANSQSEGSGEGGVSEGGAPAGGGMGGGMGGGRPGGGGHGGGMSGGGGMRGGESQHQSGSSEPVELWVHDYVLNTKSPDLK
jgi:hypothetical protein